MIKEAKIKCLGGYRLRATFSDGMAGEYDFSAIVAESARWSSPCAIRLFSVASSSKMGRRPGRMVSMSRPDGFAAKSRQPAGLHVMPQPRWREQGALPCLDVTGAFHQNKTC